MELAATLIIIGLLMMIVLPNISVISPKESVKAQVRRMVSLLSWSYSYSVATQTPCAFVVDFEKQACGMQVRAHDWHYEKSSEELDIYFGEDIRITDVKTPEERFDSRYFVANFYPNGTADPFIIHMEYWTGDEWQPFSIKVNPLTGEASYYEKYYEWEDDMRD